MTQFEELAKELGVKITIDEKGFYTEYSKALANIVNEIILSDDEKIFNLEWNEQKEIIKRKFYKVFPYMENKKRKAV